MTWQIAAGITLCLSLVLLSFLKGGGSFWQLPFSFLFQRDSGNMHGVYIKVEQGCQGEARQLICLLSRVFRLVTKIDISIYFSSHPLKFWARLQFTRLFLPGLIHFLVKIRHCKTLRKSTGGPVYCRVGFVDQNNWVIGVLVYWITKKRSCRYPASVSSSRSRNVRAGFGSFGYKIVLNGMHAHVTPAHWSHTSHTWGSYDVAAWLIRKDGFVFS